MFCLWAQPIVLLWLAQPPSPPASRHSHSYSHSPLPWSDHIPQPVSPGLEMFINHLQQIWHHRVTIIHTHTSQPHITPHTSPSTSQPHILPHNLTSYLTTSQPHLLPQNLTSYLTPHLLTHSLTSSHPTLQTHILPHNLPSYLTTSHPTSPSNSHLTPQLQPHLLPHFKPETSNFLLRILPQTSFFNFYLTPNTLTDSTSCSTF